MLRLNDKVIRHRCASPSTAREIRKEAWKLTREVLMTLIPATT